MDIYNSDNKNRRIGITCVVIAAFCFALMGVFIRLAGDLPSFQKVFFRNFIAFFIAIPATIKEKSYTNLPKGAKRFIVMRAVFGTIGMICNFYAVDHLVLSDASILNKMSPFFAIIASYFILKEKVTFFQGVVVVGAFLGGILVVHPTSDAVSSFPALVGLIGGLGAGLAYTAIRKLGFMKVKGSFIVLFFSAFSCLFSLPFMLSDFHPMTIAQLGCLLMTGICASGGQFAITSAYMHTPAKEISVYDYTQIIFSAVLGLLIFSQIPDFLSIIGYIVIVSMAILMYLYTVKGFFKSKK